MWEFYTSYVVYYNENKYKTLIAEQPCLSSLLVQGVKVLYTALEINKIYISYDFKFGVECKKKVLCRRECFPWLARVIEKGLPPRANGIRKIKR